MNTLGDMRAKGMTMLVVSCGRCGRHGRLRIARLIAHDCPQMQTPHVSIYELCRVTFPELPKLVLVPRYRCREASEHRSRW